MAKLKLIETIQTKLSTLTKSDGQLIVVRDNASLYIDLDGNRVYISDWIDIETDTDRLAMLSPLSNKYYYVTENNKVWRYKNGDWVLISSINDLNEHIEDTDIHITSTERTNWNDASSQKHSHSNKSVLDGITSALITTWNNAVTHISDTVKHITSTERTNWGTAYTHSQSAHAPSGAEVNQNAFSNVVVGTTTISADSKTDSLTLVAGSNVTLTPDVTNDKITIAATDTVYTHPDSGVTAGNYASVTVDAKGHITDGNATLPISQGGTGQTSIANIYRNIICKSGANTSPEYVVGFDTSYANNGYVSIKDLRNTMGLGNTTDALPISNGGTGATDAATARTNLGITPANIGAATTATATTSANGLMTAADKTKLDITNIAYATCSTDAATAAKVATISGNTNWQLKTGSIVVVKFTNTNSASSVTLNVNSTGAKSIWYSNAVYTGNSNIVCGYANRYSTYMYDGTNWVWISGGVDNNNTYSNASLGCGYTTCSTAEATTAKTASLSSYALATGGFVAVKFTYAVPASATLNINSKGAKAIYNEGAAITAGVIKAGDTAIFVYSSQYHLVGIKRDDNTTYSNATTSTAGLMSASDKTKLDGIATGANKYTHPSYTAKSSGLYKITVDASGHVSATTAVAKADITGLGIPAQDTTYSNFIKSGSSAKAGLVPAPSTTAGTTKYLREDGTWQTPPDTNTTYTLSSITGTLAIGKGGTGATTAAGALTNLGLTATAAELNVLDGITATTAELNYCDGVTSNIQTQLNGKAASSHGTHVSWSSTTPKANGTAAVGSETKVARGDHIHPLQTTINGFTLKKMTAAEYASATKDANTIYFIVG